VIAEECETKVGLQARLAAVLMLTPEQAEWAANQGVTLASPVETHVGNVQAIGIYRLRHRPHTNPTREWLSALTEECEGSWARFRELVVDLTPDLEREEGNENVQHQGGIKVASR
jgi:hypothetical protein